LWSQLAKVATRPVGGPGPRPPKEKGKAGDGRFRRAAAALVRRIVHRAASIAKRGFGCAAAAMTARNIAPEVVPGDALDAANPYWDFALDSDPGGDFSADRGGPSPGP
jgi:hypothetical protein